MTTQASWVPRLNITKTVAVTPVISTSIYTSGDQIGGIMTIPDVIRQESNTGIGENILAEITILDGDKQDAAIDVWFFKVSPTVTSTDNAAFAMTRANQQLQCIGSVSLGVTSTTGAYSDAAAVSVSSNPNINKPLQVSGTAANPTNIYAIAIVRGAPTYTTTSSLVFQFSFYID
jgi:hypothetical protein